VADKKLIRDDRVQHEPHPVGQYAAVCVDCIDLGLTVEQFGQNPPQIKDKVVLVFRTDAARGGKPLHIAQTFTASMDPKANLRKFLEAWRGRPYTNAEAREQGISLDALVGMGALLTIAHKESQSGNTYAFITSIQQLPARMAEDLPSLTGYERAASWEKRKQENAEKVRAFQRHAHDEAEAPPADGEDDGEGLPF